MWPAQGEMERDFALALLDRDRPPPAQLSGEASRMRRGFEVYRTNYRVNLVDALRSTFPVAAALVGDEFFNAMAAEFVLRHPPRSPVLIEYGQDLPAFIDGFAPAASVPCLGDVSRLEWAWLEAYHSAESDVLVNCDLAEMQPDTLANATLSLHPSLRLVRSVHPIASIWAAHQARSDQFTIPGNGETALIVRPEAEVHLFNLATTDAAFVELLVAGKTVEQAAAAVLAAERDFDAGTSLLRLLRCGAIAAPDSSRNSQ